MKMLVQKVTFLASLVLIGLWLLPKDLQAQQAEVSFQVFYDELAPYGRWLMHPKYGDVWAPNVDGEFTPYLTNGYWTVTQYGNTWVSNYDWGWATFHYGRWFFDEFDGWVWLPDTTWAPAWVVWRNGGGYYGWAAMSPGINFSVSFSLFNDIPYNYWCFVPQQYVWRPYVYRFCAPRHRNVYIVNNTTYVTHYTVNNVTYNYYTGPSHTEITHVTNRPVVIHNMEHGDRPGRTQVDHNRIIMYKPIVNRSEAGEHRLNAFSRSENKTGSGWQRSEGSLGAGSNKNNGHGNGDQYAPGNSGEHNNAENSDNSGRGNSGNGNTNHGDWNAGNSRNHNQTNDWRSSNTSRTTWATRTKPGFSGGNTRNITPSHAGSSGNSNRSFTPSRSPSNSSNRTVVPTHKSGSANNGRSFSPGRTSLSGGNKTNNGHSTGGLKSRVKN